MKLKCFLFGHSYQWETWISKAPTGYNIVCALTNALSRRPAIIEECARVAVEHGELCVRMGNVEKARTAATIADAIRALAPREQQGEREQE